MSFEDEYRAWMAKPIDEIKPDVFFRYDNFKHEPWYEDVQMYRAVGICVPAAEHALQVRKALKILGYATHTTVRDGTTYVVHGEERQTQQEVKAKSCRDWER